MVSRFLHLVTKNEHHYPDTVSKSFSHWNLTSVKSLLHNIVFYLDQFIVLKICLQHNRSTWKRSFHGIQGNQAFRGWEDTAIEGSLHTRRAYEKRKNFPPRIEIGIHLAAVRWALRTNNALHCLCWISRPWVT